MDKCPEPVFRNFFEYLRPYDLLSLGAVNKRWRTMLCDDKFWQLMCAEKYLIMDSNDNLDKGTLLPRRWELMYFWKDRHYKKGLPPPSFNNNSVAELTQSTKKKKQEKKPKDTRYPALSTNKVEKLQREIYSYISSYLQDGRSNITREDIQHIIKSRTDNVDHFMLHLAMLKVLFLSTTLAVDAPRFDHFGFQCTASSYLSERQLAFNCLSFHKSDYLILATGSVCHGLYSLNIKEVVVSTNFAGNLVCLEHVKRNIVKGSVLRYWLDLPDTNNILIRKVRATLTMLACSFEQQEDLREVLESSGFEKLLSTARNDFSYSLACVNFMMKYIRAFGNTVPPDVLQSLLDIYEMVPGQSDYSYHGIPHPWLRFASPIYSIVDSLFGETESTIKQCIKFDNSAINSVFSIFFEGLKLVLHFPSLNLHNYLGPILHLASTKLPRDLYSVKILIKKYTALLSQSPPTPL